MMKRNFSGLTLKDVMLLLNQQDFTRWQLNVSPRPPSDFLQEAMRRFDAFNLTNSEAAKLLLIDALFVEIVPSYPKLRVWKAALLESDALTGVVDYLIAPKRAYLATPLLCAVEAKRDDFEQGRAQCLAEMAACQWNNRQESHECDVFGVVSNSQVWQFYKLLRANEVLESGLFTVDELPTLLGALDYVCGECAKNVP
jgi:hypothetical protein